MYSLISILILIVCFLLVLIVLVQNSKGGGLASNFAETGQMMGVRKTADFLEKATWTLAGALMFFSIAAAAVQPRGEESVPVSRIQEQVEREAPGVQPIAIPTPAAGQPVATPTEGSESAPAEPSSAEPAGE